MNFNNNRIITKKRFHKIKKPKHQTRKVRLKPKKKSKKNRSFRRRKKNIHLKNKSVRKYKKKYRKKYKKKMKGGGNTPSQEQTHFAHNGQVYAHEDFFLHEGKVFNKNQFSLENGQIISNEQENIKQADPISLRRAWFNKYDTIPNDYPHNSIGQAYVLLPIKRNQKKNQFRRKFKLAQ